MLRRALFALALVSCVHARPRSAEHPMLGRPVNLALPSDDGVLVTVPVESARTTVLDFWAPSCVPCKAKLPELVRREGELRAKGARLVLVAVLAEGESTDKAKETLVSWGVRAPFLIDRGDQSKTQAGVRDLPATLVIDAVGKLLWCAPATANADDVIGAVP